MGGGRGEGTCVSQGPGRGPRMSNCSNGGKDRAVCCVDCDRHSSHWLGMHKWVAFIWEIKGCRSISQQSFGSES